MEQNLKQPFLSENDRSHTPRERADTYDLTTQVTTNVEQMSAAQSVVGTDDLFLNSTDSTLVLLYNFKLSKYQFLNQDRERLRDYYDPDIFYSKVLKEIISHPSRMPFTQSISFQFQLFIKILKYIIFLGICVAIFYSLFFFLFNPIVVVIVVIFLYWLYRSLESLEHEIYKQRKNKPLQSFLKKVNQNDEFMRAGILVVAGQQGKWIEVELQDREETEEEKRDVAPDDPVLDEMADRRYSQEDYPQLEQKKSWRSRGGRHSFDRQLVVNVSPPEGLPSTQQTSTGGSLLHNLVFREQ